MRCRRGGRRRLRLRCTPGNARGSRYPLPPSQRRLLRKGGGGSAQPGRGRRRAGGPVARTTARSRCTKGGDDDGQGSDYAGGLITGGVAGLSACDAAGYGSVWVDSGPTAAYCGLAGVVLGLGLGVGVRPPHVTTRAGQALFALGTGLFLGSAAVFAERAGPPQWGYGLYVVAGLVQCLAGIGLWRGMGWGRSIVFVSLSLWVASAVSVAVLGPSPWPAKAISLPLYWGSAAAVCRRGGRDPRSAAMPTGLAEHAPREAATDRLHHRSWSATSMPSCSYIASYCSLMAYPPRATARSGRRPARRRSAVRRARRPPS